MDKDLLEFLPGEYNTIDEFLAEVYPADIAEFLSNIDEELIKEIITEKMDTTLLAEVIAYLDYDYRKIVSRCLTDSGLSKILSLMYADDATDFLGAMPVGKVKNILKKMKQEQASELQRLLGYDDESAGGLMTTEYLAFYSDHTAKRVLEKLRMIGPDAEMVYYIYVISRKKELLGVLSVRQLLAAQPELELSELMTSNVIKVDINMDQEEVAFIFAKYDLLAVPVVNKNNQLMGIITVDDALDVIEDEATEDIYKMAATADIYEGKPLSSVKKRLPWLLILLVCGLLSGNVIQRFERSLEAVVTLAFFIPVLMDMGGNVGTQSLAVVVRGLATNELNQRKFWRNLWEEIKVGLMIALIVAGLISLIAFLWQGNPILGLVVGGSMFTTLLTAVIAGTTFPFIMHVLGADPAVAAGPFITTLIDISGLFIYFTMATILMEKLI